MAEQKKTKANPGYYIGLGLVLAVVGLIVSTGGESDASNFLVLAGGAIFLFGLVAKAVQVGVRSSRDD